MTKRFLMLSVALLSSLITPSTPASQAPAKIKTCAICHGVDGISTDSSNYPDLIGKKTTDIVKSLKEYRNGSRKDKIMQKVAKKLSDTEIQELAEYYGEAK